MIWFCSDYHINHDKDFIIDPRNFMSVEDMNYQIVQRHNCCVADNDIVYMLGDNMMGTIEEAAPYLTQLKGEIHFIIGNHDTDKRIEFYKEMGWINEGYATILVHNKIHYYLSHYPTMTGNYDEEKDWRRGLYNLFGHTHQQNVFYNNNAHMIHVGFDTWGRPVSIDEIEKIIKKEVIPYV